MSDIQIPTGVPKELTDALERSQNQYDGRLKSIDDRTEQLEADVKRRRTIGTSLKVGTVVIGILLAAGFLEDWATQALGVVVLAVVALERVFANLDRLMTNTAARDAYKRLRRQTVDAHEAGIVPLIAIRDSQSNDFVKQLTALIEKLRSTLSEVADKVETGIENKNYELINRLSLEEEAKP